MLKRVVAIFLLIAVISSSFSRFMVYAAFQVNQNYIASTLCENKARPWLHCNGQCYLMKKIKATEEKEKKQEREDQKNSYQEAAPNAISSISFLLHFPISPQYPSAPVSAAINRPSGIFQPPRLA